MRGPHDVGGLPGGPIDTVAHDLTPWEAEFMALYSLLGDDKRRLTTTPENRFHVESLGDDMYNTLDYHERRIAAMLRQLINKGVLTQDEVDAKVADLRKRRTGAGETGTGEA